jgi:hypothetical protein
MECAPKVTFATDSALEGDGFEPSVPGDKPSRRLPGQVYTEMLFAHQSCWLHVLVTVNFPVYPAGSVCSETGWSL